MQPAPDDRPRARSTGGWTAIVVPMILAGCQAAILDPGGFVGRSEKKAIFIDSLVIMLAIVLPTIAATFGFA